MIKSVMVNGAEAIRMMVDGKLAWGLPVGFKRCKYLESTGTQIIDTLYHPIPIETRIEFEFTEMTKVDGAAALMGTRTKANSTDKGSFNIFQSTGNGKGFRLDMIGGYLCIPPFQEKEKCVIDVNRDIVTFGDKNITMHTFNLNDGMPTDGSFKLFSFDTAGKYQFSSATIRIHSFSMYNKGIPVIDYVPCVDAAGVPCMYDTVSKQPFYNQGTGEFTYELSVADA